MIVLLKIAISLLPVLGFLAALFVLDSFKLVRPVSAAGAIVAGALSAAASLMVAVLILRAVDINLTLYSRYAAPLLEETFKAVYIVILFRRNRIGFVVDAAIFGFAIGAGFALVENVYYLLNVATDTPLLWVIRGFGTSAVHATATSVFAVMARGMVDHRQHLALAAFIPGLVAAYGIHSLYNHFVLSPTMSTILMLIVLPLVIIVVFERSERATRNWLGVGFDADQELMRLLSTGEFSNSRMGEYLESLQSRFPGSVVADMFCYLTLHTELALRAKGLMLMRDAGIKVPPDPEVHDKLVELQYLQKAMGKTGELAIQPILHTSTRDIWQLQTLE